MPLLLEIVTPERLVYSGRRGRRGLPGHRGRAGRPAAPCAAADHAGLRRAAHPQGRPGGVLRHRGRLPPGPAGQGRGDGRDRRPGLGDRPRGGRRRAQGGGRAGARGGLRRARRPGPGARPHGARAAAHPRRRAPPPGGSARRRAWPPSEPVADHGRRPPVPLGVPGSRPSSARPSASRAAPAARPRAHQRRQERRPQAAGRGDPDRRALPVHQRARDRGRRASWSRRCATWASSSTTPAPNTYEVAAGDVDWLFVPLEAAAKMRASFILLGPAPGALRPGHHQQPRRRPHRPAAGQPPCGRDARPGRGHRLPQRLLLRARARPAARRPT